MHEGHRQRLLDKVMKDSDVLEEHELLEALLFYSVPRQNTNETAKMLLDVCGGSIRSVLDADPEVLASVKGVGKHTAAYLKLLGIVLKEYSTKKIERKEIFNFDSVEDFLIDIFKDLKQEYFFIFFLNNKNEIIHTLKYTDDSNRYVNIDMAEVTKNITLLSPKGVLIAHNHPSGNVTPSREDDATTTKLYYLLLINNINLLDHIIVGENNATYSYFLTGRLQAIKEKF